MKQRPRPARGRLADPERTRRVVAKLHGLTAEQAAQLEGDTLDALTASARALAGHPPATTSAGSAVVDADGRTYDGGGDPVDGAGRQMVREALANWHRRPGHTLAERAATARRHEVAEDPDERRIRLEERLGDALRFKPHRARREERLERLIDGPEDPDDRRARIEARLTDIHHHHDPKD